MFLSRVDEVLKYFDYNHNKLFFQIIQRNKKKKSKDFDIEEVINDYEQIISFIADRTDMERELVELGMVMVMSLYLMKINAPFIIKLDKFDILGTTIDGSRYQIIFDKGNEFEFACVISAKAEFLTENEKQNYFANTLFGVPANKNITYYNIDFAFFEINKLLEQKSMTKIRNYINNNKIHFVFLYYFYTFYRFQEN